MKPKRQSRKPYSHCDIWRRHSRNIAETCHTFAKILLRNVVLRFLQCLFNSIICWFKIHFNSDFELSIFAIFFKF